MIRCSEAVRQMWEYLERELDPANRERVEDHLAFCRRCCGELEFAAELRRFMARTPDLDLPPPIEARFETLLSDLETKGSP